MKPIVKQVEIKEGFYPSFIYLLPTQAITQQPYVLAIRNILLQAGIQFKPVEELHLSLSRTFHPIFTEIQTIVSKCKQTIQSKKISLPVILLFSRVQILENFITLVVENITASRVAPITKEIEKITKEPYYENPVFHVSVFRIQSEISEQTLAKILAIPIEPKKSYVLNKCLMRCGKVVYQLNA